MCCTGEDTFWSALHSRLESFGFCGDADLLNYNTVSQGSMAGRFQTKPCPAFFLTQNVIVIDCGHSYPRSIKGGSVHSKSIIVKKITTALISVFHKEGLEPILDKLGELGVTIYSTGGTAKFIEQQEVNVVKVEDLTGYPSILGGRVKTLHPKVFGGILARRGEQDDLGQLAEYDIPEVDLVIVDLYPFEATVVSGAKPEDIIEKIDIGGISLIRAAAKNFTDVLTVSHCNQYDELLAMLESKGGSSLEERKYFAAEAFAVSSHYDTMIFNWFNKDFDIPALRLSINGAKTLRYGENPHQDGTFYGDPSKVFTQLHGKQTSYNNLVDIDAAIDLMREFDETTFAIIKHTNPCGVATRSTVKEAYLAALAGDPQSAFGGILICNRDIDLKAAEEIGKLFFEVLIAPAYTADALEILKKKKNRIILELKDDTVQPTLRVKSILNGAVVQDVDQELWREEDLEVLTEKGLSEES